jgi:hypothetical protein
MEGGGGERREEGLEGVKVIWKRRKKVKMEERKKHKSSVADPKRFVSYPDRLQKISDPDPESGFECRFESGF